MSPKDTPHSTSPQRSPDAPRDDGRPDPDAPVGPNDGPMPSKTPLPGDAAPR